MQAGLLIAGVWAFAGCKAPAPIDPMVSVNTLLAAPEDYAVRRIGTTEYPLPSFAKYLRDVRIVLDPGHGGDATQRGFKRGPTGVREAEMNLRVAKYLREFLVRAGAQVRLTREDDTDLSHADRAAVANDWPAHFFISLHHNAIENKPEVNYTTVWYHRDVDRSPASLDLARYLSDGLHEALRLPRYAEVPLKSDQLMYADGFAVLRHCRVPGALTESSFYTNPQEEQRLRDPAYNLREAYGVFLALARYAAAGLPSVRLVEVQPSGSGSHLVLELDDGLRSRRAWGHERQMILSDTIRVRLNGVPVEHTFVNEGYRVTVSIPAGTSPGRHKLTVQFCNMNKNSVLDPLVEFELPGAP